MNLVSKTLSIVSKVVIYTILLNLIIFMFAPGLGFWLVSRPFYYIHFIQLSWAIMKAPNSEMAFYNRATYRSEYGDIKGAISDFTKAIEVRSSNPQLLGREASAYYQRGQEYNLLGDIQKAISDYTTAAEIYKQHGKIWEYEFILNERQSLIQRECQSLTKGFKCQK